ncbi:hypothetical protein SH139x_000462 [Planctomycetaceae bacterium SH139]
MATQLTGTPLLIYEAGDRWRRTIDAWLRDDTFLVRSATVGEIRALASQVRPLVIFWELPTGKPPGKPQRELSEVVRSIRLLARQATAPLQFLAFPAELPATAEQQLELEILGRQLGAAFVLTAPEQMGVGWRLVRRYQASQVGKPS